MVSMTKPHGNKGRKQSPEHVAARVAARRRNGTYDTPAMRAARNNPSYKEERRDQMRQMWAEGKFDKRIEQQRGSTLSPETKAKMSETRRQMWADGRYADMKPATRRAVSVMERSLAPYLSAMGFRHTEGHECFIRCEDRTRMPDYVNTETREVFEFFGNFWHHPDDEQVWIAEYAKKGWTCTVLWEDELQEWLVAHEHLVDEVIHHEALRTSRARTRYAHRGNEHIARSTAV